MEICTPGMQECSKALAVGSAPWVGEDSSGQGAARKADGMGLEPDDWRGATKEQQK